MLLIALLFFLAASKGAVKEHNLMSSVAQTVDERLLIVGSSVLSYRWHQVVAIAVSLYINVLVRVFVSDRRYCYNNRVYRGLF